MVGEYSTFGNSQIAESINGITKRLGGQNVKLAHKYLSQNNYFEVAMLALQYYDKAYGKGVNNRDQKTVFRIPLKEMDHHKKRKIYHQICRKT